MRYQTHLAKRGRIYYARVRIPQDLIPSFNGKREFRVSLRTSERAKAVPLVRQFSAQCSQLFEQQRQLLKQGGQ